MKAIITGATGMVGIALVKELLQSNHNVIAIVRPNSKNYYKLPNSKNLSVIECELADLKSIANISADVFFHIAWDGVYGVRRDDPIVQKNNIDYTFDAIDLAKKSNCRRFVFAGSQAELGKQLCDIGCNNIPNPTMNYGMAKLFCNKLGKNYAQSLGLHYNSGRILSTYGENDASTTLISTLISTLLEDKEILLSDCEHIWDYINVTDVAKAFIAIGTKGVDGKLYPIGKGECKKLKYYTETIYNIIKKGKIVYGSPLPSNAVTYLNADITELSKDTGFFPQISFEEGIINLINNYSRRYL